MWKTLYTSSFGFIHSNMGANAVCTIAIQKKMDADDGTTSTVVDLAYDCPLEIEWSERSKEDPVCGSTATLKLICNDDREFVPLMTSEPGDVRLVVSASSVEIWCGILDVRQCEEPYHAKNGYEVELTFTDFGVLDRLKFDGTGVMDGETLIKYVMSKCDLPFNANQFVFNCSTKPEGASNNNFSNFSFNCDNFYDEDGVGMSCKDVIESVLQPFMMKITQRNMRIYCYDLKWLYDNSTTTIINWMCSDQTLSFDKYVNNARIIFSTYCKPDLTKEELDLSSCGTDFNEDHVNLYDDTYEGRDNPFYSLFPNYSKHNVSAGRNNVSYTIHMMRKANGDKYNLEGIDYYDDNYVLPFKIVSYNGGEDISGFAARVTGNVFKYENGSVNTIDAFTFPFPDNYSRVWEDNGQTLFSIKDIYVPPMKGWQANKFKLRLQMNLLADDRYNPFEDAENNIKDAYEYCKKNHNHTFVKLKVQLKDADGNVVAHFSNAPFLYNLSRTPMESYLDKFNADLLTSQGSWYTSSEWSDLDIPDSLSPYCWIDYYDKSNIDESCGTLGWNKNRHCVGSMVSVNAVIQNLEDGQYIPYPNIGGYIHIEVMHGFHRWSNIYPWWPNRTDETFTEHRGIRNVLYGMPKLTIVKSGIKMEESEYDDIEVNGIVNDKGLDDLEISTNCGSSEIVMPTSRGCVIVSGDGTMLSKSTRGGYTDTLENLMLATIYSQFNGHKLKISGTASVVYGLTKYRVRSEQGKYFMCTGEVMNVKAGTSEMRLVELCDENYQREQ